MVVSAAQLPAASSRTSAHPRPAAAQTAWQPAALSNTAAQKSGPDEHSSKPALVIPEQSTGVFGVATAAPPLEVTTALLPPEPVGGALVGAPPELKWASALPSTHPNSADAAAQIVRARLNDAPRDSPEEMY